MFLHDSLIPLLPRSPSVQGSPTASATLLATPALGRRVDERGRALRCSPASSCSSRPPCLLLVMTRALQGAAAAAT